MSENFKAFMELDETKYINEYVMIVQGKVVAHGEDAKNLLFEVRTQYPKEIPLIAKIPPEGIVVLRSFFSHSNWEKVGLKLKVCIIRF